MAPRADSKRAGAPASKRLLFQKVAILTWLYVVVLAVPYVLVAHAADWLRAQLDVAWWLVPAGALFVLATAAPLIYLTFLRRLEGRLLRDQRRYHRTLIAATGGMTRIKDIQRLADLIVHMVNRTVGLTHSALFLYNPEEHRFELRARRNRQMLPEAVTVQESDPLVQLVQDERDIMLTDELDADGNGKADSERGRRAAWAHDWMRKLEARLLVPSFSNDKLIAFLVLGAKRSGEAYTTDDIAIFSGLANQGALAIENAMFFEELRNNEVYMIQSEKLASLGQLASGMAHEIHNPLSIISGEAQLYLERFRGKDGQVDEVLKSIIEECQRAADITRRILRFAKPAPTDFVPVDLKATVEESISLAAYQVRMDRIERTVNIPEGLAAVRGNQNQIQEVVLNLILNACQAMGDQGGKLLLSCTSLDSSQLQLRVEDTGPGIPAAKLTKVFDPFYTTKATGTGLGLFVSQRIIKSHGGTMEVESTEGQGTCFTIRLPLYQDEAKTPASAAAASSQAGG